MDLTLQRDFLAKQLNNKSDKGIWARSKTPRPNAVHSYVLQLSQITLIADYFFDLFALTISALIAYSDFEFT